MEYFTDANDKRNKGERWKKRGDAEGGGGYKRRGLLLRYNLGVWCNFCCLYANFLHIE